MSALPGISDATATLPGIRDVVDTLKGGERKQLVLYKEWIHHPELSKEPRETHAAVHGQLVKEDQPFLVDGEELMFPGDPNGSPENIINCHCTMRHIWKEEGVLEPLFDIEDIVVDLITRKIFPSTVGGG